MRSPKFIFYIKKGTKVLSFDKRIMLGACGILYDEIHISQLVILPKFNKRIHLLDYSIKQYLLLTINIENFNENIHEFNTGKDKVLKKYTQIIPVINIPYNYNGIYSSKILNKNYIGCGKRNVEFKINIFIDDSEYTEYTEELLHHTTKYKFEEDEDLILLEVFFKKN